MGWIKRDEGWLADRVPRPERSGVLTAEAAPALIREPPNAIVVSEYGITIVVLKCPKRDCRSLEVERYKTFAWEGNKRKKYYKCKCCGFRFRVTEVNKD